MLGIEEVGSSAMTAKLLLVVAVARLCAAIPDCLEPPPDFACVDIANCPEVSQLTMELSSLPASQRFRDEVGDMLELRNCGRDKYWCRTKEITYEEEEEEELNERPSKLNIFSTTLPMNVIVSEICGRVSTSRSLRIASRGASEDKAGSWPWMASYGYRDYAQGNNGTWVHLCGGTLISHNHVLTAAHCYDGNNLWVRLGDTDLDSEYDDADAVEIRAARVVPHPLRPAGSKQSYYDVAVVELESSVRFGDFVRPVCLPEAVEEDPNANSGTLVTLTGWGKESRSGLEEPGGHLRRTRIGIFSQRYCNLTHTIRGENVIVKKIQQTIPRLFQDDIMCAGYEKDGVGSCVGDSGSPLVHYSTGWDSRYVQLGIVSAGVGDCGDEDLPGIYVRVDSPDVLEFIEKVVDGADSVSFWTGWEAWGECSAACDEGTRSRERGCASVRSKVVMPEGGEETGDCPASGSRNQTEICSVQKCLISNVRAKTSTGDNAGVDKLGSVSALFCSGIDPRSPSSECCYTGRLDNPTKDDFERGAVDDFWGFMIGDCEDFHIPHANIASAQAVHMYIDGWEGEYFEVSFAGGAVVVRCGEKNGRASFEVDDDEALDLKCRRIFP